MHDVMLHPPRTAILMLVALTAACGAKTDLSESGHPHLQECSYSISGDPFLLVADVDLQKPRLAWTGQSLLVAAQADDDVMLCQLESEAFWFDCQPMLPSLTLGDLAPRQGGAALCASRGRGGEDSGTFLWALSANGAGLSPPIELSSAPNNPGSGCHSLEWSGTDHVVAWCPVADYPYCGRVNIQRMSIDGEARGDHLMLDRGCSVDFPGYYCISSLPSIGAARDRAVSVTTGVHSLFIGPIDDDTVEGSSLDIHNIGGSPSVALTDGGAAVLWSGSLESGLEQWGIFITLFDRDLIPQATTRVTNARSFSFRLVALQEGFLAIWTVFDTVVLARQLGSDGAVRGEELVVLDSRLEPFQPMLVSERLDLDATTDDEGVSVAIAVVEASTEKSLIAVQRLRCD